jgi:hypothetical protein
MLAPIDVGRQFMCSDVHAEEITLLVYLSFEFQLPTGVFLTVFEPTSLAGRRKKVVSLNFGGNR